MFLLQLISILLISITLFSQYRFFVRLWL